MNRRRNDASASRAPVLYALTCGSPAAGYVGRLVALAQQAGWQVCVVATPDGRKFIDAPALAAQTGHPVRSHYKNPGDRDVLPAADAMVVAPATVNTVNKWACGITDTLALGMLVEGHGLGIPIAVMPYTNTAMASHPAFQESLSRLRTWGVRVLFGEHVVRMPAPGAGARQAAGFPWRLALAAVGPPQRRAVNSGPGGGPHPGGGAHHGGRAPAGRGGGQGKSGGSQLGRNRRLPVEGRGRLGPPAAAWPAPALHRSQGVPRRRR